MFLDSRVNSWQIVLCAPKSATDNTNHKCSRLLHSIDIVPDYIQIDYSAIYIFSKAIPSVQRPSRVAFTRIFPAKDFNIVKLI